MNGKLFLLIFGAVIYIMKNGKNVFCLLWVFGFSSHLYQAIKSTNFSASQKHWNGAVYRLRIEKLVRGRILRHFRLNRLAQTVAERKQLRLLVKGYGNARNRASKPRRLENRSLHLFTSWTVTTFSLVITCVTSAGFHCIPSSSTKKFKKLTKTTAS